MSMQAGDFTACTDSGDIEQIGEKNSSFIVAKGASGSRSLEGSGMGVSELGGTGLRGSGVESLDESGDFLGPLVKKTLSVLKSQALEVQPRVQCDVQ